MEPLEPPEPLEPVYLSEGILLHGGTMFREGFPVTKRRWHWDLAECGWEKIPKTWIMRLNQQATVKEHNSLYGVLDCPPDGDCFFHCMAHALNERDNYQLSYESHDIRRMLCDGLDPKTYETILGYYRVMKEAGDWNDAWDPFAITCLEDFQRQLMVGGHSFWGDWILMSLLTDLLAINLVILTHDTETHQISVYNTLQEFQESRATVLLLHENETHFKLIGHFNGQRMISYFAPQDLPEEVGFLSK